MTYLAIIENGVVINTILGDVGFMGGVECPPEVGKGWNFDGETYTAPPEQEPGEPAEPGRYRLYKLIFIQRLRTADEMDEGPGEDALLEAALNAEDPKLRMMYNAAEYFLSDDPLFAYLHWVVAVALGSEAEPNFDRADELLAEMDTPEADNPMIAPVEEPVADEGPGLVGDA